MIKSIQNSLKETVYLFALLGVIFIPFPFYLSSLNLTITQFLFERPTVFISQRIWQNQRINAEISSDSATLYALVLVLFLLAFVIQTALRYVKNFPSIADFVRTVLAYYLALQLLKYGFDKFFKTQFYLPEPNTLYTPLGLITKDLLYWSTMGISYTYNIFMGIIEIVPALLLLFRKTRILGACIAFGVFTNIVAVNFGFDISVKVFSIFLWLCTLLVLLPYLTSIYQFFIKQIPVAISWKSLFPQKNYWRIVVKIFIIGLIFLEVLLPHIEQQNFNDDVQNRPFLHGVYEVNHNDDIKRFFIHRKGYIIFQSHQDGFIDYKLSIDPIQQQMTFTNYELNTTRHEFSFDEKHLDILRIQLNDSTTIVGQQADWENLPLLQNNFHWIVD